MEITDTLDPARAAALQATLGLSGPAPKLGDVLPPFWHYIYFWDIYQPDQLGPDGHPKIGGFIPDLGLPRRMWAGGDLKFHAPLQMGVPATKRSTILETVHKSGATGPLAIVTINHEIIQKGTLCISEKQSLIYRKATNAEAIQPVPRQAPTDETKRQDHTFTTTQLFRYSALTFNGHRIHYDQTYAREQEGYPDLIVHGPMLAQLLIHLASRDLGALKSFNFKATSPLFVTETATLCSKPISGGGLGLWVRGTGGKLCMTAEAF